MPARKLLIITFHFAPQAASGTFRILGFSRHLPDCGWKPIVVAPPSVPWEPTDDALSQRISTETEVVAAPYPTGLAARALRRHFLYAAWLPRALSASKEAIHRYRPDAILTSSPPHSVHLVGWHLKRLFRLPWLADFRDPWVSGGKPARMKLARWLDRFCERAVMKQADKIIANAPGAGRLLQAAYPAHQHKISVITNGYDPNGEPLPLGSNADDGEIRIVHAGEVYVRRDPRPFLNALADLKRSGSLGSRSIRVSFVGRSTDPQLNLAQAVEERGLAGCVELVGQVGYRETMLRMRQAHVLLLLDTPNRRIGVPAKLYEYLGARRPILALGEAGSDVDWVLHSCGLPYRLARVQDEIGIRRAILDLLPELSGPAESWPGPERFTRASLTRELAALLESCSSAGADKPEAQAKKGITIPFAGASGL